MITATTTTTPPPRGPRTTKTIQHNRKQHRATRKGACGAYVISRCLKANVIHLTSLWIEIFTATNTIQKSNDTHLRTHSQSHHRHIISQRPNGLTLWCRLNCAVPV
jgi:hypothetical protein